MDKKIIIKRVITFILLLLITAIFFSIQITTAVQCKSNLPNVTVIRSSNGLNISFDECIENSLTALNQSKGTLNSEYSSSYTPVNIYKTTCDYNKNVPIDFIKGNYFIEGKSPFDNRYIVISDSHAVKYFQGYNVIGKELLLDNTSYTICGIYRSNKNLLSRLSQNGLETVYIPAQASEDMDKLPVNSIYINTQSEFTQKAIDNIVYTIKKPLFEESISVYGNTIKMVSQTPRVTLHFLAFLLTISSIVVAIGQAKKAYSYYKNENKKQAIINISVSLALIILGLLLFFISRFDLFIPSSLLPNDNIFDIKHYVNEIVSTINQKNNYAMNDYYWNYSILIMAKSIISTAMALIMSVILWIYGALCVSKF